MLWALEASLIMAVGSFILFWYYLRRGQFDDMEDAKYQMFRDEEQNGIIKEKDKSSDPRHYLGSLKKLNAKALGRKGSSQAQRGGK